MKLTYRLFGMRHATGHTDWHLIRQVCLLALFLALLLASTGNVIATIQLLDRVTYLNEKLEIREQQIARCLNGQAIGYVTQGNKQTYTICRIAEEITILLPSPGDTP